MLIVHTQNREELSETVAVQPRSPPPPPRPRYIPRSPPPPPRVRRGPIP
jgi:hypothetical protein